jgi:excisionase family DNA binding protein
MFTSENTLLTVQEVAIILKLSVLTIYKYIREHQLEAVEFGGHYRIKKSSLERFIENHIVKAETEDYENH